MARNTIVYHVWQYGESMNVWVPAKYASRAREVCALVFGSDDFRYELLQSPSNHIVREAKENTCETLLDW